MRQQKVRLRREVMTMSNYGRPYWMCKDAQSKKVWAINEARRRTEEALDKQSKRSKGAKR